MICPLHSCQEELEKIQEYHKVIAYVCPKCKTMVHIPVEQVENNATDTLQSI